MSLKWSAAHYKQKAEKVSLPDRQLAENLILVSGFYERIKKWQKRIVIKFTEIEITITFI